MKILTIDRSKWRSGGDIDSENNTGAGYTQLLNGLGYMCCLGFYCSQSGLTNEELLGNANPREVLLNKTNEKNPIPLLAKIDTEFIIDDTEFAENAMVINDNSHATTSEREEQITEHFAQAGVEVVFVGEYENREALKEKYATTR